MSQDAGINETTEAAYAEGSFGAAALGQSKDTVAAAPRYTLTLQARVSDKSVVTVETTSLSELARVMAIFNLVPPAEAAE